MPEMFPGIGRRYLERLSKPSLAGRKPQICWKLRGF